MAFAMLARGFQPASVSKRHGKLMRAGHYCCNSYVHDNVLDSRSPAELKVDTAHPSSSTSSSSSSSSSSTSSSTSSSDSSSSCSNAADGQQQCNITYRGKKIQVPKGTKLRTALLLNGVSPHNNKAQLINCRGLGTCGTCAVEIQYAERYTGNWKFELEQSTTIRGDVQPPSWTTAEQLRLNFPPHKPPNNQRLRLACQVACEGPELVVIKRDKFWGQGDTVLGPAGPEDFSLPLGELEFLLDNTYRLQQ